LTRQDFDVFVNFLSDSLLCLYFSPYHHHPSTIHLQKSMDVDRAQLLEQYRAKIREHREVELRYVREKGGRGREGGRGVYGRWKDRQGVHGDALDSGHN